MKLIIVESPHKSQTIGKFLGKDYKVMASKGHIRDLASRGPMGLGVDVEDGFKPTYEISPDKQTIVKELKAAVKKADEVFLATDPDREGGDFLAFGSGFGARCRDDPKAGVPRDHQAGDPQSPRQSENHRYGAC